MSISLDDKFKATSGRVFVNGSQALVRLSLEQARFDRARGYNTAGYISGYRGSPLGGYDFALWAAADYLKTEGIHFQPGVNEDMAATAIWGTQQVPLMSSANYDGVFSIWYGKGPGVDRSADVLKHGNYAGTSARGGVLVLCGDDHAGKSSTVAHQSDHALIHCGMPVLNPSSLQEYVDLGVLGIEMSRYSGCWVGFKCITDTVDSSGPINLISENRVIKLPETDERPEDGLEIRFEVAVLAQEARLYEARHKAVHAFARANRMDYQTRGDDNRLRLGIVSSGKAWLDVAEALNQMGLDDARCRELGIGVWKTALVWPLEPQGISSFAARCDEVLLIEEKRGVIEEQLARIIFNFSADQRPRLVGKYDESGVALVSSVGDLGVEQTLKILSQRLSRLKIAGFPKDTTEVPDLGSEGTSVPQPVAIRKPAYCAGCPHNTSTKVPDGSYSIAGIGCHGLSVLMPERKSLVAAHMGGEGGTWIGLSPFIEDEHVFQNLGDGTYFHSGLLAIRACVAAKANITYKILLNGAVGMTGGQPIEGEDFSGQVTAPHVANQVFSEGVGRVALVSDHPENYQQMKGAFPSVTSFHHRDELDAVQRELRQWKGVSVIIYDQACATERRRLRKRGKIEQASERLYINSEVCEGCGDCGIQSNCIALEPEKTAFGVKRKINQSVCNTDLSCLKGFCPSFLTLKGAKPRSVGGAGLIQELLTIDLPEPEMVALNGGTYSLFVAGIGGNGVVTVGAILGMAAHMDNLHYSILDMSGVAQRNGAVVSHLRLNKDISSAGSARIPAGSADLVIGCDAIVASSPDSLKLLKPESGNAVLNTFVAPTGDFASNPDLNIRFDDLFEQMQTRLEAESVHAVDSTGVASKLLGDALGSNFFLVGYSWQAGLLPISRESIERAISLNGSAVTMNLNAFYLGRMHCAMPEKIQSHLDALVVAQTMPETLEDVIAYNRSHLVDYQDEALAVRYESLVKKVASTAEILPSGGERLVLAVARSYARLLAYKDEYEIARIYSDPEFIEKLKSQFSNISEIKFNLAPPILSSRDPATGRLRKKEFGMWLVWGFRVLKRMKFLRGTLFDVFGYFEHRKLERRLISEFEQKLDQVMEVLNAKNYTTVCEIVESFGEIKGFDLVKEISLHKVRERISILEDKLNGSEPEVTPELVRFVEV